MSTEEQDAIAGRLAREYVELKKQLAARLAEAENYGKAYHEAAAYMYSRNRSNGGLRYGTPATCLESIPDAMTVRANCVETLKLIQRRSEIFATLKDMGLEPKDQPTFD